MTGEEKHSTINRTRPLMIDRNTSKRDQQVKMQRRDKDDEKEVHNLK